MTTDHPKSPGKQPKKTLAGTTRAKKPARSAKMTRLSTMVDEMIEPSVRKRGFVLSRLVSNWRHIAGDMADWCKPVELKLDKTTHRDGVLKLSIASGRGPQAQQMTPQIINRVNAAFGYAAVSRITLVQTMTGLKGTISEIPAEIPAEYQEQIPTEKPADDIWTLDEKLAGIKSPELRAALRRLGTPIDDKGETN